MSRAIERDTEFERYTVKKVNKAHNGYELTWDNGWCFYVTNPPIEPKPGMKATVYGTGLGGVVRGIVLDGTLCFYQTKKQLDYVYKRRQQKRNNELKKAFEKDKEQRDARIQALPEVFQRRIARFQNNNPDFRWQYEDYELFTCEQAVIIADALKAAEAIQEFVKLDWDEQKRLVPGLDAGHSGNTFSMACALAHCYLGDSEVVVEMHGALCALVGCENYGCCERKGAANEY